MSRSDMLPRTQHGLMSTAPRTKAVAVAREGRVEDRLEDLQQGLLDHPVQHSRDAQHPHSASGLRDFHLSHRLRLVAVTEQLLLDPGPVLTAIGHQLVHGHPVDARCPTVAHHPIMGC